jgi:DNA polymerase-3 subunit beta
MEEAEEDIEVSYQGSELEIGFNVSYLLDALGAVTEDTVVLELGDGRVEQACGHPAARG